MSHVSTVPTCPICTDQVWRTVSSRVDMNILLTWVLFMPDIIFVKKIVLRNS